MRIPRVYIPHIPQRLEQRGDPIALPELAARHVSTVLRLKPGAPLVVFDGRGRSYDAILCSQRRGSVSVEVEGEAVIEPAPVRPLCLAVAIARGERMDIAVQKATELGVQVVQPILSERTIVRIDASKIERRLSHWQSVMIGACEQSGRSWLAEIHEPRPLGEWLHDRRRLQADPRQLDLVFDCNAPSSLPELARQLTQQALEPTAISLLVGPEGGLSDEEIALARACGLTPARIGPRILRAETAVISAMTCVQLLWGDLG